MLWSIQELKSTWLYRYARIRPQFWAAFYKQQEAIKSWFSCSIYCIHSNLIRCAHCIILMLKHWLCRFVCVCVCALDTHTHTDSMSVATVGQQHLCIWHLHANRIDCPSFRWTRNRWLYQFHSPTVRWVLFCRFLFCIALRIRLLRLVVWSQWVNEQHQSNAYEKENKT